MKNLTISQLVILAIGLVAVSFASIFIKMCEAPSLIIAVYRLSIASAFYLSYSKINTGRVFPKLNRDQFKISLISGIFLTIHFATWISSMKYTSVASSVVLVQSAPIFVALASYFILHEKPSWKTIVGILITVSGSIIISVHDFSINQSSMLGNLLAVAGAIGAAGYMVAGRRLRKDVDTLSYVTVVYTIAAFFLLILAVGSRASFIGYSVETYLLFIAVAVIPQIIGHTVINWSLKFLSATTVSVIILAEPIGASILALIILDEILVPIQIFGGVVIIIGVVIVLLSENQKRHEPN